MPATKFGQFGVTEPTTSEFSDNLSPKRSSANRRREGECDRQRGYQSVPITVIKVAGVALLGGAPTNHGEVIGFGGLDLNTSGLRLVQLRPHPG